MAEPPRPEILAPAGSWEAFLAGLDAGADAFYLGLEKGSARGRARNFTLQDLGRLLPMAHDAGRKVYVALNTVLKESEVEPAAETLWQLHSLGVDAVILQDLGLWRVCREILPELPLHASTQMTVHNSAGVRQLERMGFARAILSRECTIPEIKAIAEAPSLPLEVFVHGALCYSVSGLCLASSAITGGSANRGWCSQPCRWRYVRGPEDVGFHPLSPSDLTMLEHVRELARIGVRSLKIEGRLKGPEYVRAVVGAYRKALDADDSGAGEALGAAGNLLRSIPSRPGTDGYAHHPHPREVLPKGADPTLGTRIGTVRRWRDRTLTVASKPTIRRGDRLRVFSARRGHSVAVSVRSLQRERTPGGQLFHIPLDERVERNDAVYRVKEAKAEEYLQQLSKRVRTLPEGRGVPLHLELEAGDGALVLQARAATTRIEARFPVTMHPAERAPLDYHTLDKHLGRLGRSGYQLASLKIRGQLPPVVVPAGEFKALRRELVRLLDEAREQDRHRGLERVAALRRPGGAGAPRVGGGKRLWIRADSIATAKSCLDTRFHRLVLPLTRDLLRARDRLVQQLQHRDRIVWELPAWLPEGDLEVFRDQLARLHREGFRGFAVTNLGHLDLLPGPDLDLVAGRELHCLNGWAAAALGGLGCRVVTASPESDGENLGDLAARGWPAAPLVVAYGNLPLFTTRLDPGVVWKEGKAIRTGENVELHWQRVAKPLGQNWFRVYAATPLCWTQHMAELRGKGVGDYLFDFEGRAFTRKELGILLKKFNTERPLKDSSEWNWERGLK
jgi:putative protease